MSLKKVLYNLISNNRIDIRKELVNKFLEESAGTGKKELCSKYDYTVETYGTYKIIIKRPGQLNKGFDFIVHTDGIKFNKTIERHYKNGKIINYQKSYTNPEHDDIIKALEQVKVKTSVRKYEQVKNCLKQIYNVEETNYEGIKNLKYIDYSGTEHPFVVILLAIKWLFIEQDITYWNWSGRNMLKASLEDKGLM